MATTTMLEWLRRDPRLALTINLGAQSLPLTIRRRANAKRMTLRLAPDGSEARISIPQWGRTEEALAFARSRADWLALQLARLPVRQTIAPGGTLLYRGALLTIEHSATAPRRPQPATGVLRCGGPAAGLAARLSRWLEVEATRLLEADLLDYCTRAGLAQPRLALSRAQRRWGSCASSGTIRINWRLVMAPDRVRRSVVAHKVAHLLHFNHSRDFHATLAKLYEGDLDAANRWLRHSGRSLYAPFG